MITPIVFRHESKTACIDNKLREAILHLIDEHMNGHPLKNGVHTSHTHMSLRGAGGGEG